MLHAPKSSYVLIQIKFQQKLSVVSSPFVPWGYSKNRPHSPFSLLQFAGGGAKSFPNASHEQIALPISGSWYFIDFVHLYIQLEHYDEGWSIVCGFIFSCNTMYRCSFTVLISPKERNYCTFEKKNLFLYSINLMLWPAVSNNQVNIG